MKFLFFSYSAPFLFYAFRPCIQVYFIYIHFSSVVISVSNTAEACKYIKHRLIISLYLSYYNILQIFFTNTFIIIELIDRLCYNELNKLLLMEAYMKLSTILVSMGFLVFSSILAGFSHKLFKKSKNVKPIYILLTGAFLATLTVMLYVDHKPNIHGDNTTLFLAMLHSVQVMLLGYDFEFLYESIKLSTEYAGFAFFYLSVLFFLAPVYTFSFVLSFFESITSYILYFFKRSSDIFILSDLSEKSLFLAKSIREKFPKATISFMNVFPDSSEEIFALIEETKKIKSLNFKKNLSDVTLKVHKKNARVTFFAINENETTNLESALEIIQTFNSRKNTELYVFSTSKEGQLLLDSVENGNIKVRRINEDRSLAYSLISNKLITDQCTKKDGRNIISTLIIGFGGYGSELTKALLWCGQLPDYDLELNVIDKNPDAESYFRAECPEILLLNNNTEIGEARYNLNFFNGIDVHTHTFNDTVSALSNTSVVYVSLGNDELNIETAINVRILFERIGLYPVIRAIVYSDIKCRTLSNSALVNHQGKSYDIEIIGNVNDRFSYDTIINKELESLALECHLRWSNSPEEKASAITQFEEYEYYRNSSITTAIHEKYRKLANMSEDLAAVTEHMRWNAYMRTEGFIFSGSLEKSTRNDRAKMHNNLHRFGLLSDEDINKDRRIVSGNNE